MQQPAGFTVLAGRVFSWPVLLAAVAVFYVVSYLACPHTPGHTPGELGWWAWADQGKYLTSTMAMGRLDADASLHYYPPLYPALGVPFYPWLGGHLYFVVNLAALLWFCFAFLRFASLYLPRWAAFAILAIATLLNGRIFENYLVPWTSTLSDALLATGFLALVWLTEVRRGLRASVGWGRLAAACLALGLIVPTRPADAVVGLLVGAAVVLSCFKVVRSVPGALPGPGSLATAFACALCGPVLLVIFNSLVFHGTSAAYEERHAFGYFLDRLPEKLFSFWVDGSPLGGPEVEALAQCYPWLLVGVAGLVWAAWRGDFARRTVAAAIIALFVLYVPFAFIIPDTLWNVLSIHYFKWIFPFVGLFALLLVRDTVDSWLSGRHRIAPTAVLIGVPLSLLSLQMEVEPCPVDVAPAESAERVVLRLPPQDIDFLDLSGVAASGGRELLKGEVELWHDGERLRRLTGFRIKPLEGGLRINFPRPLRGGELIVQSMPGVFTRHGATTATGGQGRFALRWPDPRRPPAASFVANDYRPGEVVDFRRGCNSHWYRTGGWGEAEDWGTWTVGSQASLRLRLVEQPAEPLVMDLEASAMLRCTHADQRVEVRVNGARVWREVFHLADEVGAPRTVRMAIPREALRADGIMEIRILTPDAVSPRWLFESPDRRRLGLGVTRMRLASPASD